MNWKLIHKISSEFSTEIPIWSGKPSGWRIRAKLAVRQQDGKRAIGLFAPGTHRVIDLIDCKDHHPLINHALSVIREANFIAYDEKSSSGDLRYIQLTVSRCMGKVQLVLVANGKNKCLDLAEELRKKFDWHSIWINVCEGVTNTIFGREWIHLSGSKFLEESILEQATYFHPACFIQANLDLYEKILLDIKSVVMEEGEITELYAGVGTIAKVIDKPCILIESNPYAEESFRFSDHPPYLQFITAKSEDCSPYLKDILIVDPPRKGLDHQVIDAIQNSDLSQLIYLSCNPKTLKRDVELLKGQGWALEKLIGYDLFPGTNHLEILAILKKSG